MARPSTDSKEKILEAACKLIAQKGYRDVTHKEICSKAGVNSALINYYYGSKEKLYEAVWEYAFSQMKAKYNQSDADLPCEKKLEAMMRDKMLQVFDESPAGWFPAIVHREMTNPSNRTRFFRETYMDPMRDRMQEAVQDFLNEGADEIETACAAFGVMSICIHVNVARQKKHWILESGSLDKATANRVVDELVAFAMGGLYELRKRIASK